MKVQSWPASRPLTGSAPGDALALGDRLRAGAAGWLRGVGLGVLPGADVVAPGSAVADGDVGRA